MDRVGQTALESAIRERYGCEPAWADSESVAVAVIENAERKCIWRGEVQVFDLVGHHDAKRAYVWSELNESGEPLILTVLQSASVPDAVSAVRSSLRQNE
jgi:hypothetical protein